MDEGRKNDAASPIRALQNDTSLGAFILAGCGPFCNAKVSIGIAQFSAAQFSKLGCAIFQAFQGSEQVLRGSEGLFGETFGGIIASG